MFKHIVMWNYKEGFTPEQNKINAQKVKQGLEGLKPLISEIVDIKVIINELSYSNKDVLLDSTFKDEAAFLAYKANPEHLKAAVITKEVLQDRVCLDYVE